MSDVSLIQSVPLAAAFCLAGFCVSSRSQPVAGAAGEPRADLSLSPGSRAHGH